jgi:hypothetical protein
VSARRLLLPAIAALLLAGCASAPAQDAALPAPAPLEGAQAQDGTTVQAIRVVPHAYPIEAAGHVKPGPCIRLQRHCDVGADVRPPGQPTAASAGVEWTTLSQAFTDPDGLFWRIRLDGAWGSSTPAVDGVTLFVGTRAASCGGCEPRLAFAQDSEGSSLTVARTDVFLHDGEDTLVFWVEPHGVGGETVRPADDVKVELRGWAAAFVADGQPVMLTANQQP